VIAKLLIGNFALVLVLVILLWLIALRIRDVTFVDSFWAYGMVAVAAFTHLRTDGDPLRKNMLLGLCAIWGLRLGTHLLIRWGGREMDPRYRSLLDRVERSKGWGFAKASLIVVFLLQAPLLWIVCLPVQLGQVAAGNTFGPLAWMGAAVAVFGIAFESIGDWQLARFRASARNRGRVLDTGLWRYTRHPNYFGDACTWWGLYAIAADSGAIGAWSIPGPLVISWLLTKWSGAPLLERGLRESRPEYESYIRRTSGFVPWPPRRETPAS
jgi:steroid 5-alpha reductase family enzyme